MSVHKRGERWQVRWRENGRQHSRTFEHKADANHFDRDLRPGRSGTPIVVKLPDDLVQWLDGFVAKHAGSSRDSVIEHLLRLGQGPAQ
jgi:hypothetical protein